MNGFLHTGKLLCTYTSIRVNPNWLQILHSIFLMIHTILLITRIIIIIITRIYAVRFIQICHKYKITLKISSNSED